VEEYREEVGAVYLEREFNKDVLIPEIALL